ncbi:hypothetical protein C5167_036948 [Papaver somniferum]|uniref:RIN4 pathogenic type III effector avirulence factor Avr cleavage site domain-containing protein n=1 Tax=Papaver somniferum TaxID=3469 RepID=A0A4Y7I8P5_PAPSO|nr:hypothetical protein C5167_036948 [Papaver somniferum]
MVQSEESHEKNGSYLSVPQFGDWDQKGGLPDYSMDFSKIREMRKQNKRELSRASIGNEEELNSQNNTKKTDDLPQQQHQHHHQLHDNSPAVSLSFFLSFFPISIC